MAMFDDFDDDDDATFPDDEDEGMPEESSNKTFMIAVGVLGGIILLALIGFAIAAMVVTSNKKAASTETDNAIVAQKTEVAVLLTEAAVSTAMAQEEQEPLASPSPIFSPTASQTPVVAVATDTPTATPNAAATGTIAAALTEASEAVLTPVPVSSALPDGGFADDVGVPGLVVMMLVFIAVIFFARRLRSASVS